ncbi:MAG: PHB depolymerase family esterase [Frankiaceae bacterium]|nr:PHB depolymerase family esterase [Frankiaceae bacterium]
MRRARLLALLVPLVCLVGMAPASAATETGTTTAGSYTEPGGLTRQYLVHLPPGPSHSGRPLVLFLHGCNQTAEQAESATQFSALADARDFIAVYPKQVKAENSSAPLADGNGIACWNWFLPEHQERGSGEPAVLAGLARHVAAAQQADPSRVYVEGISAGGAMSVILGATYPDVFAAVASLAGCSYRACSDDTGALTHAAMGPRARVVPIFVENGTADTLNPAAQSVALVQSYLGADDLADDGAANGSVERTGETTPYAPDGTPNPGGGDACVHNNTWTCPGGAAGLSDYPYTVSTYADDLAELWLIYGMAHAQPHASDGGPYTDPLGPDITAASYDFFLRHPMPDGPTPVVPEVPFAALLPIAALLVAGLVVLRRRSS